MLRLLLPGSTCVYYGGEIGLEESTVKEDQRKDFSRSSTFRLRQDNCSGPMPWDDTKNGGFTKNEKPWVPLSPRYTLSNVKRQLEEPNSHLKIFKRLVALRKSPAVRQGDLRTHVVNTWTYLFTRTASNDSITVIMNLGSKSEKICSKYSKFDLPEIMFVHTGSLNSGFKTGDKVRVMNSKYQYCAELRPKAGLVLTPYLSNGVTVWSVTSWLLFMALGINTIQHLQIY